MASELEVEPTVRPYEAPPRPGRRVPGGATLYGRIKPVTDRCVALTLLAVTAPVILAAAAAVRLTSRGPAFYSQVRLGRGGRPFRIHKIRTMHHRCEASTGPVWALPKGDPRVTPVGRFLRKTHLDELPQLWNVVRGDMSLVGPRPERPELVGPLEAAVPRYRDRLLVRPGITGLAQVQLPPDTSLEDVRRKLACDLYYIHRSDAWLDARILVSTAVYVAGVPFETVGGLLRFPSGEAIEQAYLALV